MTSTVCTHNAHIMRWQCTLLVCWCYVLARSWAISFINETALQAKVTQSLTLFDLHGVAISRRSLVIYRIGEFLKDDSLDVVENNLKIFSAAVDAHGVSASHQALYIFRVAGGKRNPLARHLPSNNINVVFTKCTPGVPELPVHVHTINLLGEAIVSKFHSVLFLNQYARGPFEARENGRWWDRVTGVFNNHPRVGILGPSISCEVAPHVQTHVFAMRGSIVSSVMATFNPRTQAKRGRDFLLETAVTTTTLNMGYNASSLFLQRKYNETVFSGVCRTSVGNYDVYNINPTSWCDIHPEEALFMKFGGQPLSVRGYYCQKTVDLVHEATMKIAYEDNSLHLALPETIFGGQLYSLSKEYDLEAWSDNFVTRVKFNALPQANQEPQKVCFLVRAAIMHGRNASKDTQVVRMDIDLFIKTLLRQSNPNWDAYFFVTDDQPFDEELKDILKDHKDIRLKFLDIEAKFRPKYHPVDAAYPASDEAMRIIAQKPECVRLSVTNGDNAYGSGVVESILSPATPKADLMLLPMDSRNFANEDCRKLRSIFRNEGFGGYCKYFEKRHLRHLYGFARIAQPVMGGVDLAAVFIDRNQFVKTNIYFNAFSSAKVATCMGCQDGTWVEHMVAKRGWTTHIPAFNGFKHMIFHGPSPLWCIAGGNVWYDHPDKVACLSHKTAGTLSRSPYVDFFAFHHPNSTKVCLRLNEAGFNIRNESVTVIS